VEKKRPCLIEVTVEVNNDEICQYSAIEELFLPPTRSGLSIAEQDEERGAVGGGRGEHVRVR